MFWVLFLFILSLAFGDNPTLADAEIVVEAHRSIEVYVSPIEVIIATDTENIEAHIDSNAAFAYSSSYWPNAKIENERGAYEPIKLNHDKIRVYNEDTIIYAWENCKYKISPLKCSMENSHYYVETTVHIDDNELVVRTMLFDQEAQVIAQGTSKNKKIIKWIKQQEIQQQQTIYNQQATSGTQRNCSGSSCSTAQVNSQTSPMATVTTSKPKEELPLKWVIPHRLLDRNIQQAMLLMWCSVRMDLY